MNGLPLESDPPLFTSASGVFLGAEYANRDGSNARRDIVQPCLCVYRAQRQRGRLALNLFREACDGAGVTARYFQLGGRQKGRALHQGC